MVHSKKIYERIPNLKGIKKLAFIGMFVSLAAALINTIWAVYLNTFFDSMWGIGLFSALLAGISFFSYFVFIPVIEKYNKSRLYSLALFLLAIFYILFALNKNFYFFIFLAVLVTILTTLRITTYGIIVRKNSLNKELSKNEGTIYTLLNLSWVIGPLVAGYILARLGIGGVFAIASIIILLGLLIFRSQKQKKEITSMKIDRNPLKNFLDFFKDKDRKIAYILGGGVNLWWSLIYLFMPVYIIRSGLGGEWVSYLLFGVAIPLVLFERLFSRTAGKKGFKGIFKEGYLIVAMIALLCFYTTNIYALIILLVIASIGMAMLEPTTEAYFFDILKKGEENRFYGPYNTAIDSGGFIGRISASLLLIFLPFKFIFLLFSLFMFVLFLLSFKTKNIIENKK